MREHPLETAAQHGGWGNGMTDVLATRRGLRRRSERAPGPSVVALGDTYFPAVDGLRALAILSVLVFHTGIYTNGLFGVDIFFVLSGYLITLTLLREHHRTGKVRLGQFYVRRAKRLLPLLLVVLGGMLVAVLLWGLPRELERFGAQAAASLVYLANWEQIGAGQEYWAGVDAINPLGHMWSLSITEQFYLAWPPLLVGLLLLGGVLTRRRSRSRAPWLGATLVLVVALVGVVVAQMTTVGAYDGTNPDRIYLGTDTHVVGLVAGAAAGAVTYLVRRTRALRLEAGRARQRPPAVEVIVTVGVTVFSALCAACIVVFSLNAGSYTDPWLYAYGFVTVAVLAALLTLTLTSRSNLLGALLSVRPLVGLGMISYTLFLVHLPIYWLIGKLTPWAQPVDLLTLGVPASIVVAFVLHYALGEPLRKNRWKRQGTIAFAALMVAVGIASVVVPGFVATGSRGTGDLRVLTLGDSLADDIADALGRFAGDELTVTDGGFAGCGIAGSVAQRPTHVETPWKTAEGCNPWQTRWEESIRSARPDVVVVNIAWDAATQVFEGDREFDLLDSAYASRYRGELDRMAALLEKSGARVLIANARLHNAVMTPAQAGAFNRMLDDLLVRHPGFALLDLQGQVCDAEACATRTASGEPRYLDDRVHFSDAGKEELARWLAPELLAGAST